MAEITISEKSKERQLLPTTVDPKAKQDPYIGKMVNRRQTNVKQRAPTKAHSTKRKQKCPKKVIKCQKCRKMKQILR